LESKNEKYKKLEENRKKALLAGGEARIQFS